MLGHAFHEAWDALQRDPQLTASNSDEVREALTFRIIEMAKRGERDPVQLRNDALVHVRGTIMHCRR